MFEFSPEDLVNMKKVVQEKQEKLKNSPQAKMVYTDYGDKDDMLDAEYPYPPEEKENTEE